MLKKLLFFTSIVLLTGCSSNNGEFTIKGSTDVVDGNMIYRIIVDANQQPLIVDSLVVKDGSFEIKGMSESPDVNFFSVQNINGNLPFILESGTLKTKIYKDSLMNSRVVGTVSNDAFMQYKDETKGFINSMNGIGMDLQQASIAGDSLLVSDLQDQYKDVQDQIKKYETDFIKTNTDAYISALILERFITSNQMTKEEVKTLYDGFTTRIKNSKSGKKLAGILETPPPPAEVGQIAPGFEGPGPKGELVKLENSLGKITVVDFWASWCRPCRIENPNLVRTYNKLKDRGLKIIGVSLDKNKDSWIKAIDDDALNWDHVSHLQYWNEPIAKSYQVRSIPATFILDENGRIIAKNLRGSALEQKLEELLSN